MEFLIALAIIIGSFIIGGVVTVWKNDDLNTQWSFFIIGGCLFLIILILLRILTVIS